MLSYEQKQTLLYQMEWERDLLLKVMAEIESSDNTAVFTLHHQLELLGLKIKYARQSLGLDAISV